MNTNTNSYPVLYRTSALNKALSSPDSNIFKTIRTVDKLFALWMTIIPNPDNNIRREGIQIYEKTLADPIVTGCTDSLIEGLNAMEYEIVGNDNTPDEVKFLNEIIENLFEQDLIKDIFMSAMYGSNFIELMWEKQGNYIIPVRCVERPQEDFHYVLNKDTLEYELRVLTINDAVNGEEIPQYKLLAPTYKSTARNPYGKGLLSNCYKSVFIKDNAWDFWSIFVENNGTPKIDTEITHELAQFLVDKFNVKMENVLPMIQKDISSLRQDGVFTHFTGLNVKALDSGNVSNGITHKDLMDFCDKQIAILLLGHNGASQAVPGKLGNDRVALSVLEGRIVAFSHYVADYCNVLLKWIHEINFNTTSKAPQIKFFNKKDISEDIQKAVYLNSLMALGMVFEPEYLSEITNISTDNFTVREVPIPSGPPTSQQSTTKASEFIQSLLISKTNQKHADDIANTLEQFSDHILSTKDFTQANSDMIQSIVSFIQGCDSYEAMLHGLYDLYPDMPVDDMKNLLTRMMLVSNTYGNSQGE